MSQLFVELYLDEDVSVLVARILRSRGFTAVTTQEAGQVENSDQNSCPTRFVRIRLCSPTIAWTSSDFRRITFERTNHKGIIIAIRRTPFEIARRLLIILDRMTADEMDNQLIYL